MRTKSRSAHSKSQATVKSRGKTENAATEKATSAKGGAARHAGPMQDAFPIVGIGASAGGLEAITEFLAHIGNSSGLAFVVTQHLDPSHASSLPILLGRATSMTVCEARNNMKVGPNQVFVIPPNKAMCLKERRLKVTPRKTEQEARMPIDHFFESLAEQEAARAIGVLLSGNGSDGTRGLVAIKAAGGTTFAQDEATAKYTAMPASAVAAACVDFVLPPAQIARELITVAGRPSGTPLPLLPSSATVQGDERCFQEILAALRVGVGVDFTQYKHQTLERRIRRRMGLHRLDRLPEYTRYLRSHPAELKELFNDILIHVTGFFRDPGVFGVLKRKILPRLLKHRRPDDPIRVWVPGCSSGEEVYSLAIVLMETLTERRHNCPVQIFGTDINLAALDHARAGYYPASIAADVSQERLRGFFTKLDSGYRINKGIREMCLFARQNVVVDPPFSNLDLVSCRNLLIYLGQPLQRKVFPVFHYALKPTGFLLLGAAETVGTFADLFSLADKKCKAYAKKATVTRPAVTFARDLTESPQEIPAETLAPSLQVAPSMHDIQKQADRVVLTHFSPAGVVINRRMEVLQFRRRTGLYLEHSHGEASLNLLKMAREGLGIDLRAVINKSIKQNARVRQENVRVKTNGHHVLAHIEVHPIAVPPSSERFYFVCFESTPLPRQLTGQAVEAPQARGKPAQANARELGRLREELTATRESLQAIIEEQEATNEELRSANEEIMSSNEELQSTNEELETAKEELQSTNEELTTLNDELESRNGELESVNNDLHNVLASVNIPIIIVGLDARIRRFTAVAEKLFNIVPTDVGRPLADIKTRIELPNLDKLITEVIDTLQTRELEIQCSAGHWWSVRIRPYKTTDNKIDGAVLAFVDVDHAKASRDGRPPKPSPQK